MSTARDLIVGIDLGTTFSLVAYADDAGAHILRDDDGEGRLPSVIAVAPDAAGGPPRITLGWDARRHALESPRSTVYSIKRLIGRSLDDIRAELPFLAYAVAAGPRNTIQVEIDGRRYSPEKISSVILRALRERAERLLGRPVRKSVITVPAYFDDAQRQATRDAGRAAGLEVVRIINEPTAAALAYGIGLRARCTPVAPGPAASSPPHARRNGDSLDPGAGSVSLPLPRCRDQAADDRPRPSDAAQTPASNSEISSLKPVLSDSQTIAVYDLGGGTFDVSILRLERDVFQVLATAGDTHLGGDDFDRTIIERVQREVREQFGLSIDSPATRQALRTLAEAVKVRLSDHAAAPIELDLGNERVYRRTLTRDELEQMCEPLVQRTLALWRSALRDAKLTPDQLDRVVLVGGSTRMPLVRRRVEEAFGRPPYTALNPDEVVALGAALQGAILGGADLDMLLLDVTPLSLGIETMGGAMGKLILRNATIPCRASEMFTTFVDGQTAIRLTVLQGERELAADCRRLGEFELRGIPPMPAGLAKVEVEFLIDANGILNVSARELRSGQHASIQIAPNYGLTPDEVERMMRDSLAHGRDDLAAHRRIDLANQVEFDTHKAEQMLARVGDRLDAAERRRIEADIRALRAMARDAADLDALHEALQSFGRGTVRLAELGITEALVRSDALVRSTE